MTWPPVRDAAHDGRPRRVAAELAAHTGGGVDDDGREDAQAVRVQPVGGRRDAQRGHDAADAEDGRGHAAHARVVLAVVDRVAGHAHLGQLLVEGLSASSSCAA